MSRRARLLGIAAAAAIAVAVTPRPPIVAAHAGLDASLPAANSVLADSPDAIVLDFDEPIDAALSAIDLFAADAREVTIGAVTSPGDESILTASVPNLDEGLYAVRWRVASADGHVVSGSFAFQVGNRALDNTSAESLLDQVAAGSQAEPIVNRLMIVARALALLGIIVWFGVALLGMGESAPRGQRRWPWVGLGLVVVGTVAALALYSAQTVGGGLGDAFDVGRWGDVAATRTGRAYTVRLMLCVAALGVLLQFAHHVAAWFRWSAGLLLFAVTFTYPMSGHAAALSLVYVINDAVHLAAVGLWIGGLLLLAASGSGWFADESNHPLVHRFSRTAVVAVPVVVATGVIQTLRLAGGLDDITATDWGRLLLVKVTIVVVIVGLGGVGRWLLRNDGAGGLRRGVLLEAALGVVVVGLAAALVAQPPRPVDDGQVFTTTLTSGGVIADVTVTPGRVGANEVHIVLTPPGGQLNPVISVQGRMSNEAEDIANSPIDIVEDGNNHFTGRITLPEAGLWRLELVVETGPAQTVLLSTEVEIPS